MNAPRCPIIWEDMHIRDERAFTWIQSRSNRDGLIPLKREELAKQLGCHENTAAAILQRLIGAGLLAVHARRHRCYVYRIVRDQ